jgi:hypothetical protein
MDNQFYKALRFSSLHASTFPLFLPCAKRENIRVEFGGDSVALHDGADGISPAEFKCNRSAATSYG